MTTTPATPSAPPPDRAPTGVLGRVAAVAEVVAAFALLLGRRRWADYGLTRAGWRYHLNVGVLWGVVITLAAGVHGSRPAGAAAISLSSKPRSTRSQDTVAWDGMNPL